MIYNLVQIIGNSAKKFPLKEAFRYLDESITYSDLDIKTNQLASHLLSLDVKKGDRVGVLMHRCLETSIAIYGILKSGAAYVPIDPFVPNERVKFLINDCGIKHLVTTPKQEKKIKKILIDDFCLFNVVGISKNNVVNSVSWEDIYQISLKKYKAINILAEDLAYILYTSGSTGTPKGIMHTHYSGLAFAKLVVDLYDFKPTDKVVNIAPLHFDVSLLGYFSAPLSSATTVIVSDAHLKFPTSLAQLMEKEQLTIWYSVPLVLIQLLLKGGIENKDFSSLRWVLFAGEVFVTKQLKALMQLWTNTEFSNIYGPTELNQCTYYNLSEPPKNDNPIPIGTTWKNTEYKILDSKDEEVEHGKEGLLVVRSATMMKGYWNNTPLTESSLYKEKIAPGFEYIYYRTGDLVKLNKNNELLFLGRKDRQIKFRGYRIEIDEIENILIKNEAVIEVAVVLTESSNNKEKELSATVLLHKDMHISLEDLKTHCKKHLPIYAVPTNILILKTFPRTSSGKIDRKKIEKIIENA
ncbi:amino acid adenylation domain-containing protein [Wocania ichthyoenteri]|uniref:amino acid adenylation domain-containing protein n=1 Tax=Wocania ichthyoenteri TaxID=1230531 RepID=UPI000A5AF9F6|nr:amino acid adenylation domain-containing protein [Wocania ichthyoenteri]